MLFTSSLYFSKLTGGLSGRPVSPFGSMPGFIFMVELEHTIKKQHGKTTMEKKKACPKGFGRKSSEASQLQNRKEQLPE